MRLSRHSTLRMSYRPLPGTCMEVTPSNLAPTIPHHILWVVGADKASIQRSAAAKRSHASACGASAARNRLTGAWHQSTDPGFMLLALSGLCQ
ncbi:hypothetical protein IG631_20898 [Alternaria alternata]|nr:hypothetical protein IG631_20898 [Alternaria alternata]